MTLDDTSLPLDDTRKHSTSQIDRLGEPDETLVRLLDEIPQLITDGSRRASSQALPPARDIVHSTTDPPRRQPLQADKTFVDLQNSSSPQDSANRSSSATEQKVEVVVPPPSTPAIDNPGKLQKVLGELKIV